MPILVNGEVVPRELIREEEQRLARLPEWQSLPDDAEKRMRLREASEVSVVDRILLRQEADKDSGPIDPSLVASEVQRLRAANGCRVVFDDGPLTKLIEGQLRLERTMRDLMGPVPKPAQDEIARFYRGRRGDFAQPEMVQAAHIVKHIDETHTEAEAQAGIEAAQAALDRGESFAAVADRYSDCRGNGGDLGYLPRGIMVEEFDNVVFRLRVGERSPIFRTPFGFHIAEVRARKPAGIAVLGEVKEIIERFLAGALAQDAVRRAAGKLRARADVRRISTSQAEELTAKRRSV